MKKRNKSLLSTFYNLAPIFVIISVLCVLLLFFSLAVFSDSVFQPQINSSRISPLIAYANDTLIGYCNATDEDGDNLTYYYNWYLNGILNKSGLNLGPHFLIQENCSDTEGWYLNARYDGDSVEEFFNSDGENWGGISNWGANWKNLNDNEVDSWNFSIIFYQPGSPYGSNFDSITFYVETLNNSNNGYQIVFDYDHPPYYVYLYQKNSSGLFEITHFEGDIADGLRYNVVKYSNGSAELYLNGTLKVSLADWQWQYRTFQSVSLYGNTRSRYIIDSFSLDLQSSGFTQGEDVAVDSISNILGAGQNWTFECIASDGIQNSSTLNSSEASIMRSNPVVDNISLSRTYFGGTIFANATAHDVDGDDLLYYYEFYNINDYEIVQSYSELSTYITQLSDESDIIQAKAKVFDGTDYSSEIEASIHINNIQIMNSSRILPLKAYLNDTLLGYCNATDKEGDDLTYYYNWYLNGILNKSGDVRSQAGSTWTQRANEQDWIDVASDSSGERLVALVDGGNIFTSNDSGATWTETATQQDWVSVASSSDGTKLIAAVSGDYLYLSNDSGATWTETATQQDWVSVASSSDGTKLIAAVSGDYLYLSNDSGATWTETATQQDWVSVASSSDGKKLTAVVNEGNIYTSNNCGITWSEKEIFDVWISVASSSDGKKLIVAAYGGNIYTSSDSGTTWTVRANEQDWIDVASDSSGERLVALVDGGNIFTSNDSGVTWTDRENTNNWYSVASSSDGKKLTAIVNGGNIYTSVGDLRYFEPGNEILADTLAYDFVAGQNWTVECIAFDGYLNSSSLVSTEKTIKNYYPEISNFRISQIEGYIDTTYTIYINCSSYENLSEGFPMVSFYDPNGNLTGNLSMDFYMDNSYKLDYAFSIEGTYSNFSVFCRNPYGYETQNLSTGNILNFTASARPSSIPVNTGSGGSSGGGSGRTSIKNISEEENKEQKKEEKITETNETLSSEKNQKNPNVLFDIIVDFIQQEILRGQNLTTKISLINFGIPGKVNVSLSYMITDSSGNIILEENEVKELETQIEFLKTFELPAGINTGDYNLNVQMNYGENQEASSQNIFKIRTNKEIQSPVFIFFNFISFKDKLLISACLIAFFITLTCYILIRKKSIKTESKLKATTSTESETVKLKEYIDKHIKEGYGVDEIRNSLIQNGWPEQTVKLAFSYLVK